MRSRVNSCMFFWALAQGSMVQRPSCSTSSSVTSLFAVFFLNAHWNHCTATRTVKVLTLHLRQGCTTCGLRWKCMRLWPRNSKCKLWGPCICKNSLSALWGYSVERRPNRRVEAEPKQCKKLKLILNSVASVFHKNKRDAVDSSDKVILPNNSYTWCSTLIQNVICLPFRF